MVLLSVMFLCLTGISWSWKQAALAWRHSTHPELQTWVRRGRRLRAGVQLLILLLLCLSLGCSLAFFVLWFLQFGESQSTLKVLGELVACVLALGQLYLALRAFRSSLLVSGKHAALSARTSYLLALLYPWLADQCSPLPMIALLLLCLAGAGGLIAQYSFAHHLHRKTSFL